MFLVDILSQIYCIILKTEQKFCNFAVMTRKIIPSILACAAIIGMFSGCDNQHQAELKDFTVTCALDSKLLRDSATLLVLEEGYNQLRVCGTAHPQQGTFTFKGQTDGAKVALIRWGNDSTHPFHFVLEPGTTQFTIHEGSWSASGSTQNVDYLSFINQRNRIMKQRVALWQQYLNATASSSLTREEELRMVRQDSLLNDTLQNLTVQRINRGDAVSRIVRERFAAQLDQEHMRQLK